MSFFKTAIAGVVAAMTLAPAALAQDLTADEATDVIRSLAPKAETATSPQPRVRLEVAQRVIVIDPSRALDFEVYFEFDSARLTPQARDKLRPLGRALASEELRGHDYLIAGHTDASGSAAYNKALSDRRARAVRRYLVEAFPIEPERLVAAGFGESRLKRPDSPYAALNRRVQVALIVPDERGH